MMAIFGSLFSLVHLGQVVSEADVRTKVGPPLIQITLRSYNFKQGWATVCFRKLPLVAKVGVA